MSSTILTSVLFRSNRLSARGATHNLASYRVPMARKSHIMYQLRWYTLSCKIHNTVLFIHRNNFSQKSQERFTMEYLTTKKH